MNSALTEIEERLETGYDANDLHDELTMIIERMKADIGYLFDELKASQEALGRCERNKPDYQYPRDLFNELITQNSPYAFYIFQWIPYQTDAKKWRLKMHHDVKSFDGEIEYGVWPNGDSCGRFKDSEVEFIRISKDQVWGKWEDPRSVKKSPPPPGGKSDE